MRTKQPNPLLVVAVFIALAAFVCGFLAFFVTVCGGVSIPGETTITFFLKLMGIAGAVSAIGIGFLAILRWRGTNAVCEICGASDTTFVGKWGSTRVVCKECYEKEKQP